MLLKNYKQFLIVPLIVAASIGMRASTQGPIVKVSGGEIVGRTWPDGRGATFRGIPYAEPPVGNLRWREPKPVKKWSGLRDASTYAAPCAQVDGGWNSRDAKDGKEDCLYLNVSTPHLKPSKPMPVMVWVHGGANWGGSARGYAGIVNEPLAGHGVVLVTIQYRLGYFGFLAHPDLTKESSHKNSGSYALQDQIAALKWVRSNIARFGGDPKKVTIFGQSAGAYDIAMLVTSPVAKGLFVGAIEESSPAIVGDRPIISLAEAEKRGERFAMQLHAPAQKTIAYLRSLPATEIVKASPPYGQGGLGVIVDGYVLPVHPAEVYATHREQKVPLIVGNNSREYSFGDSPEALRQKVQQYFGKSSPVAFNAYHLEAGAKPLWDPKYGNSGDQFLTDTRFRCQAVFTADYHSQIAPTYEYEYSHPVPGREKVGAAHSAELGYVFGNFFMAPPKEADRKLSAAIQGYWTNFAKTGNPNGESLLNWPKHDVSSRGYVEFTSYGPVQKRDLRGDICRMVEKATLH